MAYRYQAFELEIACEIELPELAAGDVDREPDVTIRLGDAGSEPAIDSQGFGASFERDTNTARLLWSQVGQFRIEGGRAITIRPIANADENLIRLPLLGAVMAVLLQQRGLLVMHASVIELAGGVAMFLGDKRAGKSTTAAALVRRGHRLMADDIGAVAFQPDGRPHVLRGFPQIKLNPDSLIAATGLEPDSLRPLAPGMVKQGCGLNGRFAPRAAPLFRIYRLEIGDFAIARLPIGLSLTTLIANSYASRYGRDMLNGSAGTSHLQQCAQLLRRLQVHRLSRPADLGGLDALAEMIERDMALVAGSPPAAFPVIAPLAV